MSSESTIRRLVHKALEAELAGTDAGVFADERARSFFAQLKSLVNSCFHALHDAVTRAYSDPVEQHRRLRKGLTFIASEKNEAMSRDELNKALAEFPNITEDYHRAMVRFAQCVLVKLSSSTKIECPSFETFLFRLYRRVAASVEVTSGRYFLMSYLEQDIFLKDMVRLNMTSCMSVRDSSATATGGGARASSYAASHIMPSDSVSNVSARVRNAASARRMRERVERERSTFNNALSAATEHDRESTESSTSSSSSSSEHSSVVQPLTKTRLHKHRERTRHHEKHVPEPPPKKEEERVVEIMTGSQAPIPLPAATARRFQSISSGRSSRGRSAATASDMLQASEESSSS